MIIFYFLKKHFRFCDPVYKFPSQAACVEMAISILIQKEESMYRKKIDFSKLLIVCGTYTIGNLKKLIYKLISDNV